MALHHYRYSMWDGTQDVPDFSADDLLENMADDLLRGGDPERALQNLLRRGFELPDGRRFEGLQRLLQQMREYRRDAFSRWDPNGLIDSIREKLEEIVQTERQAIDQRQSELHPQEADAAQEAEAGGQAQGASESPPQGGAESVRPDSHPQEQSDGTSPSGTQGNEGAASAGQEGARTPAAGDGADQQFRDMLDGMLSRKEEYLDALPEDNAGRIHSLREYDFLSPEAREAFEELVGGMQRQLMEQYFQGLKEGVGAITPDQMASIREMVRDLNEMLEASQAGDREAFDRFMEKHGQSFPPGINNLEELLEHMQRQMSSMQALLDNMDPEMRAQLEAMMDELLRDDRLRLDLARLGHNLAQMGYTPQGGQFPFRGQDAPGFGQALDMMKRLQAMRNLEQSLRMGDGLNALTQAGGADPNELFGPRLGGQIEAVKDLAESMLEAGYLQREGDRLSLTSRAVRKLGDASLREIFQKLKEDRAGGHAMPRKGIGGDVTEDSRTYQFGDPFHIDVKSTVMNGVYRNGPRTPVRIHADDLSVFQTERSVQHATVLALDMSHSMYLSGLFIEAKKTALALDSLIRSQFPRDALYLIGFASTAFELKQEQLPTLVENDYVVGTNYQMALGLARRLLSRHRGGNRQILFVTDGEPTACTLPNGRVLFDWPPPPMILDSALMEAARCAKERITINTFVLDPDPTLIGFVQRMTATNKGRMFLAGPYHLGEQVVLDYLNGRTVRRLH